MTIKALAVLDFLMAFRDKQDTYMEMIEPVSCTFASRNSINLNRSSLLISENNESMTFSEYFG